MKIHSIEFKNYRCFIAAKLDLSVPSNATRNIVLIEAEQGGGKTEMLFAFWWVFYGYDFRKLSNKDATPYALNSKIYRLLEGNRSLRPEECFVQVQFEYENMIYTLRKTEIFQFNPGIRRVDSSTKSILYRKDKNGVTSPPVDDADSIARAISQIIPERVLYGILFDGERMQKLSSSDKNARESVKGVIDDVTSVEVVKRLDKILSDISTTYTSSIKKNVSENSSYELAKYDNKINQTKLDLAEYQRGLTSNTAKKEALQDELESISIQLKEFDETKAYENRIREIKRLIQDREDLLKSEHTKFVDEFDGFGFSLLCETLENDVSECIRDFPVPEGLNVQAVKSILKQGKCICERPITENEENILKRLMELLPPDNLNAALREQVNQSKSRRAELFKRLKVLNTNIERIRKELQNYEAERIQMQRSESQTSSTGKELTNSREQLTRDLARVNQWLNANRGDDERMKRELRKTEADRSTFLDAIKSNSIFIHRKQFTDKCLKSLRIQSEMSQRVAFETIQGFLDESYRNITDDYQLGRRIRLIYSLPETDGTKEYRFKLVSYFQDEADRIYKASDWKAEFTKMRITDDHFEDAETDLVNRFEIACIKASESSSTGQGKVNAIAFVQAILRYASQAKDLNDMQIVKDYPLIIDSPFGDMSGPSLELSAGQLPRFAKQVILMINPVSRETVASAINPMVCREYLLKKNEGSSYSSLEEVKNHGH